MIFQEYGKSFFFEFPSIVDKSFLRPEPITIIRNNDHDSMIA